MMFHYHFTVDINSGKVSVKEHASYSILHISMRYHAHKTKADGIVPLFLSEHFIIFSSFRDKYLLSIHRVSMSALKGKLKTYLLNYLLLKFSELII